MASRPEITTTSIETPSSPEEITASKEIQDVLNATAAATINSNLKDSTKVHHRLSLRLSSSPGGSPQSVVITSPRSPKSPNRSISPHLSLVNKLYEEELLADELITTAQVDKDIIEAVNKLNSTSNLTNKQLYSPNRSPTNLNNNSNLG